MFNGVGFFRFRNDKWDALHAHSGSFGWYLATLFNGETARYLLSLLAPLAFLPLLAPGTFALALPGILINILSAKPFMITLDYHYTYAVNPFLIAGAVEGAARLWRRCVKHAPAGAKICARPDASCCWPRSWARPRSGTRCGATCRRRRQPRKSAAGARRAA